MMNQGSKKGRKRGDEQEEQRNDQRTTDADYLDLYESEDDTVVQRILKHPIAIGVMIVAGAYVALHVSSYFLDAGGKVTRSYRKFRHALKAPIPTPIPTPILRK